MFHKIKNNSFRGLTFVPHCVIKEAMKRKHFINLANRNELSGDDVTVREGVCLVPSLNQPIDSYNESVPCTGDDLQASLGSAV